MSGTPVRNFTDFWTSTGPWLASGPDQLINDAAARTWTLKHFLKGKKFADVAQGGRRIEDELFLDNASTAEFYHPGATGTPTQPQVLSQTYQNWRWLRDSKAWQDEVLRLQAGGATRKARFQVYKRLAKSLEMRLWTSILMKMEAQLWANPHGASTAAQMETETGNQPCSIPALITEDTTNYHPNGWSTIQGLDPATEDNWRNPVTRYNKLDPLDTAGNIAGLFDAFELMWMLLTWMKPGKEDENFTESNPNKGAIFCSRSGKLFYQNLCRASNDNFMRAHNDPSYAGVNFHGAPIEDVEALETAQLYLHSTTSAVTENDSNLTDGGAWSATNWTRGPRFWFVNPEHTKIIFHEEMFFDKTPPKDHVNQPWANVVWMRCCYNLFANSRKRAGGVVSPGGTAYAA
jgi:hypothetical protein